MDLNICRFVIPFIRKDKETSSSSKTSSEDIEIDLEIEAEVNIKARDELFQLQEENTKKSNDATSRRINSLRAVMISMLYDHHRLSIKEHHLKDKCPNIQPNEIKGYILIYNLLML
ncbi:hypothetical protein K501DRAFT_266628 [Backusella circina FSU 941]|nr:hypothetical protein K501DRAFT_266628 [Backusella circina FSU 941]